MLKKKDAKKSKARKKYNKVRGRRGVRARLGGLGVRTDIVRSYKHTHETGRRENSTAKKERRNEAEQEKNAITNSAANKAT